MGNDKLRFKVERALRDSIAPQLLNETVDCVIQILEGEIQDSYDKGYSDGENKHDTN